MNTFHLPIQKTARYCTLGELNDNTQAVWIVCHGYGQLAPYFIPKFSTLLEKGDFIIAPEALSRFYLEGFSGRVGATWMTKEDREYDIDDNRTYLNTIYDHFEDKIGDKTLNVLGFSQGVATICRWVILDKIKFDNLILWAGVFPPDLNTDFAFSMDELKEKRVFIVYGDSDAFLKPEHLQELDVLTTHHRNLRIVKFIGKHDITKQGLEALMVEMNQPL